MITRRKKKEELGVGNFDLNEMKMIKYVTIKKKMTKKIRVEKPRRGNDEEGRRWDKQRHVGLVILLCTLANGLSTIVYS